MSTPKEIHTAGGPEISLDPDGGRLQFAISEMREHGPWWRLIATLTRDEATELRDYISNWLAATAPRCAACGAIKDAHNVWPEEGHPFVAAKDSTGDEAGP